MPIEKRQIDPKTFELRNTDRDQIPIGEGFGYAAGVVDEHLAGREQLKAQMFEEAQANQVRDKHRVVSSAPGGWATATSVDDFLRAAKEAPRDQKNAWREQFRNLDKGLKKGADPQFAVEGIQEMLDTGAIYMDDDGNVYSAVPGRGGTKRNDRLLNAAGTWGDWYRNMIQDTVNNGLASQEMDNTVAANRD